jgi:hypothetical protein
MTLTGDAHQAFPCDRPQAGRLTARAPLGFRQGPLTVLGTPAGPRRHGDQRTCSLNSLAAAKQALEVFRLAGRPRRPCDPRSSHENAERVSGRVGEHIQGLILVVGAVEQFSGTET